MNEQRMMSATNELVFSFDEREGGDDHFFCGECLMPFQCPVLVEIHFLLEHIFKCACNKKFRNKQELLVHLDDTNCRFSFPISNPSNVKSIKGKKCKGKEPRNAATVELRNDKNPTDNDVDKTNSSQYIALTERFGVIIDGVLVCLLCGNVYLKRYNLYHHFHEAHKEDVKKVASGSSKNSNLQSSDMNISKVIQDYHLFTTSEGGKLCCSFCNKHYPSLLTMTKHLRHHSKLLLMEKLQEIVGSPVLQKPSIRVCLSPKQKPEMKEVSSLLNTSPRNTKICKKQETVIPRRKMKIKRGIEEVNFLEGYVSKKSGIFLCLLCGYKNERRWRIFSHLERTHKDIIYSENDPLQKQLAPICHKNSQDVVIETVQQSPGIGNDTVTPNKGISKSGEMTRKRSFTSRKFSAPLTRAFDLSTKSRVSKRSSFFNDRSQCKKTLYMDSMVVKLGHRRYQCRKCRQTCTQRGNMYRHIRSIHGIPDSVEEQKSDETMKEAMLKNSKQMIKDVSSSEHGQSPALDAKNVDFTCQWCREKLDNQEALVDHINSCNARKEANKLKPKDRQPCYYLDSNGKFQCYACKDKRFDSKAEAQQHLDRFHGSIKSSSGNTSSHHLPLAKAEPTKTIKESHQVKSGISFMEYTKVNDAVFILDSAGKTNAVLPPKRGHLTNIALSSPKKRRFSWPMRSPVRSTPLKKGKAKRINSNKTIFSSAVQSAFNSETGRYVCDICDCDVGTKSGWYKHRKSCKKRLQSTDTTNAVSPKQSHLTNIALSLPCMRLADDGILDKSVIL